ncbi:hypothetical protein [Micromonospora coxensis]|uniref:Allene oxide cyclase barrel-like domain-containing protein n=1 Tax=Micromonospora coxensis TaxID=356852 RepID=A0A1C5JFP9_9ACTN|nr:hypothetical protein [Micromonospora coxensis]SCG69414.1 hypothetical protein GA0070614_4537 [Micromonospora coxensis]
MATFFRRKAAAVTLGVLALTLAGGGIAAAQPTTERSAAQVVQPAPRSDLQPRPSAERVREAKAALAAQSEIGTEAIGGAVSFAVVKSGPGGGVNLLVRGHDAIAAYKYGPGQYEVFFNRNVARGGFVATIGTVAVPTPPTGEIPLPGEVGVAPRGYGLTNAVFVQTRNSAGVPTDLPFHLAVHTP